jgi:hypothetical protein
LLAAHDPPIQALAQELRRVVQGTAPEAVEGVRTGWHSLAYSHPVVGYFCGIFPREGHVDLVLEWGVLLDDAEGLFTLRGGQVGTVRLRPGDAWDAAAVTRLLHAALALPPDRSVRAALARERRR